MKLNTELIEKFEAGLNPKELSKSKISVKVLGYGEISTVFQLEGNDNVAYKRMPLFTSQKEVQEYITNYSNYCNYITECGINLPIEETYTVNQPGKPKTLYICQEQFPAHCFCNKQLDLLDETEFTFMLNLIIDEINKVFSFKNQKIKLAIDGQLSNWVWVQDSAGDRIYYIDTSTPLYKINNREQLDPELFLQSAPSFLRWIIRWLFLGDVMDRYYDKRLVLIDVVGNLFKEQHPEFVTLACDIINRRFSKDFQPITPKGVEKYYKEDKLIWILFLAFRRIDRWIKTNIFRLTYHFILPGKIQR